VAANRNSLMVDAEFDRVVCHPGQDGVRVVQRGRERVLDNLLLERLAIAAATFVERYGPARTTMADPALVELVISADGDEAAGAGALRLLGSSPNCRSEPSPCARVLRSTV
jgi:hypothetical protein